MEWIEAPLTFYIFLAAGLSGCLYLFYSAKKENAELRRRLTEQQFNTSAGLDAFRRSLEELRHSVQTASETPPVPAPSAPSALNVNRRSQALRMHRRGETPEHIAAALQMPRNEVDLLIKLNQAPVEA